MRIRSCLIIILLFLVSFSIFSSIGIAYTVSSPTIVIVADTLNTSTINSNTIFHVLMPQNNTVSNGIVTVRTDTIYFEGNKSELRWINITYNNITQQSTYSNYSYIPHHLDLYGGDVTIKLNGTITVKRKTTYVQVKNFYWIEHSNSNIVTSTIVIPNVLSKKIRNVHVFVEFYDTTIPDYSTVKLYDVSTGQLITSGANLNIMANGIDFEVQSIDPVTTEYYTCEYELDEETVSNMGIVYASAYGIKSYNNREYWHFKVQWINHGDENFIGDLLIDFNFSTFPYTINPKKVFVYDNEQSYELSRNNFSFNGQSITISQDTIGILKPTDARTFDVYFLFVDKEDNLELEGEIIDLDLLNFPLFDIPFIGIPFVLFYLLMVIGFCLLSLSAISYYDERKDRQLVYTIIFALFIIGLALVYVS